RRHTDEALRETRQRYELVAGGAADGLWDWNLETDEVFFSPRWKSMLGYSTEDIAPTADAWFDLVHPDHLPALRSRIQKHLDGVTSHFEDSHRIRMKTGSYRWVLARGIADRDADGNPRRMAGSQTDTTHRKLAEDKLRHDAVHDTVTGLPNRTLFMDRLEHAIQLVRQNSDTEFAVLFLDLDRFKVINDSLGRQAGDQLLRQVAGRLSSCLRATDAFTLIHDQTIARLGGDEFAILLENVPDMEAVTKIADRIQGKLTAPYTLDNTEVYTSASIGIAMGSAGYENAADLLRDSDAAMHRAKSLGKDRHELFDQDLHREAVNRLQIENALRRALEAEELRLYYQPIILLETGAIDGFEALVRWHHPQRGVVPPAEFIPIAEETGLIGALGEWILREACRQMKRWCDEIWTENPGYVSVNLSTKQFSRTNMARQIKEILAETGLDPRALALEVTESVIMLDPASAAETLSELRAMEIQISIDDFGTGYSSLSYLHEFPFDIVKIDRSFVGSLEPSGQQYEIVQAICTLAHAMGMKVTAEGVESEEQLEILRGLHCEHAQGYLFSRAVPAAQAAELIATVPTW
ncbi:MAG: putative bifunctional diguanylate cyclase/phosphodiesterase, partial [Planctomycetota bacterium]